MKSTTVLAVASAGIFLPLCFYSLPSNNSLLLVLILLALLAVCARAVGIKSNSEPINQLAKSINDILLLIILFVLAFSYGTADSKKYRDSVLDAQYESDWLIVRGRVAGLVIQEKNFQRFDLVVNQANLAENLGAPPIEITKIRLSYYLSKATRDEIKPGDILELKVKLKRPRGLANDNSFDYQRWLVSKRYSATGYVREVKDIQSWEDVGKLGRVDPLVWTMTEIDRWRSEINFALSQSKAAFKDVQAALLIGNKSSLNDDIRELYLATGVMHLMVISGFHVGFVAAMGYFLGFNLGRLFAPIFGVVAPRFGLIGSMATALLYAGFVGFSLPASRAVLMLSCFLLPRLFLIQVPHSTSFFTALLAVALLDPLAPLDMGFWLSFGAVGLLFLSSSDWLVGHRLWSLLRVQLLFLCCFSPVVLHIFGRVSIASLPANLVAVPLVGLLIVPLEFLSMALYSIGQPGVELCWFLVGQLVAILNQSLQWLDANAGVKIYSPGQDWLSYLSIFLGFMLASIKPKKVKIFIFSILIVCLLRREWMPMADFDLKIKVYDVGQGLAVLIEQPQYQLLFDTGPKFGSSFSPAKHIIQPDLLRKSVRRLSTIVLSHPDADHIGEVRSVAQMADRIWVGRQLDPPLKSAQICSGGESWQIEDVTYRFLYPMTDDHAGQKNNHRSCVLEISWSNQNVLLTGDIEARDERKLLSGGMLNNSIDLIIAPHHGSNTSSTPDLLEQINPKRVVFSSGYKNRFGHPHPKVVARYEEYGSAIYSTAVDGMIEFEWSALNEYPQIKTARSKHLFWWQK